MKTLIKTTLAALAIAGAALTTTAAPASAQGFGFYIGPDGARVGYTEGYYYDRYRHRHAYRYPRDWRNYGHPLSWYRTHRNWHRDGDWYRR